MNPGSRGGKSEKKFQLIHSLLDSSNCDYDYALTKTLDDAYDLSKQANSRDYDVIAAVGGDGTINRVLNGFYDNNGKRISSAKFGVIYTGTSPDFCKTYNIPLNTEKAVNTILNGGTRLIDVGRIEFGKNNNNSNVKYFCCCANIGLGAMLAERANSGIRKIWGDTLGTFFALMGTLMRYKQIDIKVNGESMSNVYNLSVGKTYYVASGLKIAHELNENDSRFYMLPVQERIFSKIAALYAGKPLKELRYADEIEIIGSGRAEFDGDEGGSLPCRITNAERLEIYYEQFK